MGADDDRPTVCHTWQRKQVYKEELAFPLSASTNVYSYSTQRFATTQQVCSVSDSILESESIYDPSRSFSCIGYSAGSQWEALTIFEGSISDKRAVPHAAVDSPSAPSSFFSASESSLDVSDSQLIEAHLADITDENEDTHKEHVLLVRNIQNRSVSMSVPLSFRPLAVTIQESDSFVLIWMGSADEHKLYCWELQRVGIFRDGDQPVLRAVDLDDETAFRVVTPVMGIYSFTYETTAKLGMSCQDGTVRLVTFRFESNAAESPFVETESREVIVDGPILCLQVLEDSIIFGSLSGYVASISMVDWIPRMVVDGLWNAQIASEDGVLAVHQNGDSIAVGMHSGSCCLYCKRGETYDMVWERTLPYPVYAVQILPPDRLFVGTRRSCHVFFHVASRIRAVLEGYGERANVE